MLGLIFELFGGFFLVRLGLLSIFFVAAFVEEGVVENVV